MFFGNQALWFDVSSMLVWLTIGFAILNRLNLNSELLKTYKIDPLLEKTHISFNMNKLNLHFFWSLWMKSFYWFVIFAWKLQPNNLTGITCLFSIFCVYLNIFYELEAPTLLLQNFLPLLRGRRAVFLHLTLTAGQHLFSVDARSSQAHRETEKVIDHLAVLSSRRRERPSRGTSGSRLAQVALDINSKCCREKEEKRKE